MNFHEGVTQMLANMIGSLNTVWKSKEARDALQLEQFRNFDF